MLFVFRELLQFISTARIMFLSSKFNKKLKHCKYLLQQLQKLKVINVPHFFCKTTHALFFILKGYSQIVFLFPGFQKC